MTRLNVFAKRLLWQYMAAAVGILVHRPALTLAQTAAPGRVTHLPAPSGPAPVGRMEFTWTDSTRAEPFVGDSSARRELVVFVWYPAEGAPGQDMAAYIPHVAAIAAAIGDSGMEAEFGTARAGIVANLVRSHSFNSPRILKSGRPFPTLIFSPGFGESSLTYATQLEDLASHGYLVIGIEHPFDTYAVRLDGDRVIPFARARWDSAMMRPKGAVAYQLAQVPLRAADILFVLDQLEHLEAVPGASELAGSVDLQRIGAFGHSLGGMSVASACRVEARIRACMNQDAEYEGRPFDGGAAAVPIEQPFLFFATGHSVYVSPRTSVPSDSALGQMKLTRSQYDSVVGLYQHNQDVALAQMPGGAVRIEAEADNFTHRTFMDLKLLQATDSIAARDQAQYLERIREYVRAFFDASLRGTPSALLAPEGPVDSIFTIQHFGKR
jgi:predicted dienelactone hydrolase